MATPNPTPDPNPHPTPDPIPDSAHAADADRGRGSRGSDPDRILVNGLVVEAYIGVHDFERDAPQRVRFDIVVETVDDYADRVRTAGAYVSYADLVEFVMSRAASGEHVELVETWADDVATFALSNELAQAVQVTVQKIDIFDAADGVGITIERRRR